MLDSKEGETKEKLEGDDLFPSSRTKQEKQNKKNKIASNKKKSSCFFKIHVPLLYFNFKKNVYRIYKSVGEYCYFLSPCDEEVAGYCGISPYVTEDRKSTVYYLHLPSIATAVAHFITLQLIVLTNHRGQHCLSKQCVNKYVGVVVTQKVLRTFVKEGQYSILIFSCSDQLQWDTSCRAI